MNLERLINLGSENPEIFQAGLIFGMLFMLAFMFWNSIIDVVASLARYVWEKTRAIKIENDKKSPPKKLFGNLFKKKNDNEKE